LVRINDYVEKIKPENISSLKGKKAYEDPQLIIDLESSLRSLFSQLIHMEQEDAIKWMIGWIRYTKDKKGDIFKYTSHQYNRGKIVFVDLFGHMGTELTYAHPAVILYNGYNYALVAPISSAVYGDTDPLHIDLETSDGVTEKCGVRLDDLRIISKQRILKEMGKITNNAKLDEIDLKIVEYFTPKIYQSIQEKDKKIMELEEIIIEKENKIKELEDRLKRRSIKN
jgi:mRNA-degrading endonuclease toxin of MazEF toxin-antitoxin module